MADGMGRDLKLTAARTVVVLAVLLLALFLYSVRNVIMVLYVALIVAIALRPIVLLLERRMPRVAAAALVYLALLSLIAGTLAFAGPQLVAQIRDFVAALPDLLAAATAFLGVLLTWAEELGVTIDLGALGEQVRDQIGRFLFGLVDLPLQLFQIGVSTFAVVALSFYWILDRDSLLELLFSRLDEGRRLRARTIMARGERSLEAYVQGLALAAIIVGVLAYLGLWLLGVRYAVVLALIAGLLEVIPIVGPVVAALPIAMVAFTQSPILGLLALAYWLAVQQFENYIIVPVVQRATVNLSPFVLLLSVLAGAALGGVAGAFLSIPTAVLLSVLLDDLIPVRPPSDLT